MRNWNVVGQRHRNSPTAAFVLLSLLDEQDDQPLVEPAVAERIKLFEELIQLANHHSNSKVIRNGKAKKRWKSVSRNRNSLASSSSGYASSGQRSPPLGEKQIDQLLNRFSSDDEEETDCRFSDIIQDEEVKIRKCLSLLLYS